jgi:4-hydroxybenzoate polyprenyltransferase
MSLPAPGTLLRVIRWPNLVIIALTQYTVAIFLSPPSVARSSALDFFALTALIGTTVSIAAAGYVMNDILDQTNDRINKPTQIMIGSEVSTTAVCC